MSQDKALIMGNGLDVRVHTLDCGIKLFRTDAEDFNFIPAVLVDSTGREQFIGVTKSTVLVMVPMADFGGWPYDPLYSVDPVTNVLSNIVDGEGRAVFSQRVVIAKSEIFDMVRTVMGQEKSAIARPSMRDVSRISLT